VLIPHGAGEVVAAAVADGAGSAASSHIGAITATATATALVQEHLLTSDDDSPLERDDLIRILHRTRRAVFERAEQHELEPRDLASTLMLGVFFPDRTLAAHIGDGAIVIDDGLLRVLSWPEQGEYANMTVFFTMQNAVENARIYEAESATRFALLSDGLQGLALSYATQEVYAPFVDSMLKPLANAHADTAKLEVALTAYLSSEAINRRTDDDKTLVLGVRRISPTLADERIARRPNAMDSAQSNPGSRISA
jgi:serine/threonine protein phosphatase PrpC